MMQKSVHHFARTVLCLVVLPSLGCADGQGNAHVLGGQATIAGSGVVTQSSAGALASAGGAGATAAAISGAGRGGMGPVLAGAGAGGSAGAAGSRGSGRPRDTAGSGGGSGRRGSEGGRSAAAGSGAAGRAGSPAAGSGSTGAIWQPKPGVTWQWQLTGRLDTSVDVAMYDIDLFTTSEATIEALHGAGRIVICYFSAGTYEPDRPDSDALEQTGLGSTLDGWPDEKWADTRSAAVRELMAARLDLAKQKGCDGVEPDNVDGYDNRNGLGLTEDDALDYDRFLATESHARGLSIGLKNSLGLVSKLVSSFDWALNEECLEYDECETLEPFIAAGKAVFHCEYGDDTNSICGGVPEGFSTIVKNLDLDASLHACQ